ncbi:hypothetical protein [Halopiger goleimassiliensis]|uniref:hypothetical protein n=1 Tax=Halopiger goleimassiliensis TaxID=1293048 RepID=UPI0006780FC4|nr:hypothetical protein [Halopiger goleimassiliensis]
MAAAVGRSIAALLEKGDGRPPGDVIVVSLGLFCLGLLGFWFAILVQVGGPVVDSRPGPQTIAGIQYSACGAVLWSVVLALYQRRPIGWYGAAAVGLVVAVGAALAWIDAGSATVFVRFAGAASLGLLAYLLARRRVFFR